MQYFILFLLFPLFLHADPWGKDASLIHTARSIPVETCTTPLLGPLVEGLLWFHQTVVSPADGPRSHYFPSSSQYTLEAIRRYGFFKGYTMGCDRLMRENSDPWVYERVPYARDEELKYNPVP